MLCCFWSFFSNYSTNELLFGRFYFLFFHGSCLCTLRNSSALVEIIAAKSLKGFLLSLGVTGIPNVLLTAGNFSATFWATPKPAETAQYRVMACKAINSVLYFILFQYDMQGT